MADPHHVKHKNRGAASIQEYWRTRCIVVSCPGSDLTSKQPDSKLSPLQERMYSSFCLLPNQQPPFGDRGCSWQKLATQ